MVPIPFVLGWYGRNTRERSPWTSVHVDGHEGAEAGEADEADETEDMRDEEELKLERKDSDN